MLVWLGWMVRRTFSAMPKLTGDRHQDGAGMIEVLVALSIFAGATTMFLSSLLTGSHAVDRMHESVTASTLATSQIEHSHYQDFLAAPTVYPSLDGLPPGYTVISEASPIPGRDSNIQKLTVSVYRDGELILVRENLKANR